jgi:membrane-bound metal-dependent hydrolase YbcI (DUF457 family)
MMTVSMPSPLGHVLAGLSVGWFSERASAPPEPPGPTTRPFSSSLTPFVAWCAVAAAIPDADLLIPHFHRTATHSLTATTLVLIIAAGVTGKVTRRRAWVFAWALAAAHASHLLLDWLGVDRFTNPGIQLLWPFSDAFYISDVNLFPPVERRITRPEALGVNLTAALTELALLGPVAAAAWFVRRTRRSRARTFGPDAPQRPSA